jgi:hypothetical protein
VVIVTLKDRILNDGLQYKTRRHLRFSSFLFYENGQFWVRLMEEPKHRNAELQGKQVSWIGLLLIAVVIWYLLMGWRIPRRGGPG